jgi:hypothetical protein
MLGCSQVALSTAYAGHQLLAASQPSSSAVSLLSPPMLPIQNVTLENQFLIKLKGQTLLHEH